MVKYKGTLFVEKQLLNDRIFSETLNKDLQFKHSKYICIKDEFKKHGIDIHTQDILPPEKSNFSIFLDYMPHPKGKKNYLIVREPPTIIKKVHRLENFKPFDKIFTWNDDLVDNKKIIKYYNQSYDFEKVKIHENNHSKTNYILVCSKKTSFSREENYSLRNKVINFFENSALEFELYGKGWDKMKFNNRIVEAIYNRLNLKRPTGKKYKNYKGIVDDKRELCSNFKFQFSIENTNCVNGYITEKIFDSFFSSCVPIYSGAPNISDYIPSDCYINLDHFKSIKELIDYTESIKDNHILEFINSRDRFLNSSKAKVFSSVENAKILSSSILNDL